MGFYPQGESSSTAKKIPLFISPRCSICKLDRKVNSPKMPVNGEGGRKILIIGEAPGETEDNEGIPFVGRTGRLLELTLSEFGVDLRTDCWIANTIRCRPWQLAPDGETKRNRPPSSQEIAWCRPYLTGDGNLYGDIAKLQPEVIILLGSPAVNSIIGWLWKEDPKGINRWAGWQIPCQKLNAWIAPTWHPSYVIREDGTDEKPNRAVELLWREHLKSAVSLQGRPWDKVPNYANKVIVEMSPYKAASIIRSITDKGKPAAFDYENNCLKPDGKDAEIICCSISNGEQTIAYPWQGEAVRATQEFLKSSLPKIASNVKHEERWSIKEFGHGVNNWCFDTMLAAHVLDNRRYITGLKFQSFVLLGQGSYDDDIKPFFQSKGASHLNKIDKLYKSDPVKILRYCGLDSLLEHKVAKIQAKKLGIKLE